MTAMASGRLKYRADLRLCSLVELFIKSENWHQCQTPPGDLFHVFKYNFRIKMLYAASLWRKIALQLVSL